METHLHFQVSFSLPATHWPSDYSAAENALWSQGLWSSSESLYGLTRVRFWMSSVFQTSILALSTRLCAASGSWSAFRIFPFFLPMYLELYNTINLSFSPPPSLSVLSYTRGYKDSLAQYGQRGERTVPGTNPGQGYGRAAGGPCWDNHRQHHPQWRQR